jgi:hypothetical protein
MKPTYERVRGLFEFLPTTGFLIWKVAHRGRQGWSISPGGVAGRIDPHGYVRLWIDGRYYSAANVIWLWMTGSWPENVVDEPRLDRQLLRGRTLQ